MKKIFVIERDEDDIYAEEVSQLKVCYSQGYTVDDLMRNTQKVMEPCLEELEELMNECIGIQKLIVNA